MPRLRLLFRSGVLVVVGVLVAVLTDNPWLGVGLAVAGIAAVAYAANHTREPV